MLDIAPEGLEKSSIFKPKTISYKDICVSEDSKADKLSSEEKAGFKLGFSTLRTILFGTTSCVEKMVLSSASIVSALVGYQPFITLESGEAPFLYQALVRQNPQNWHDSYRFYRVGNNYFFLNLDSAKQTLHQYQFELGLSPVLEAADADEIESQVMNLFTQADNRKAHLANGLLSGFPLEACEQFVNQQDLNDQSPFQTIKAIGNPSILFNSVSVAALNPLKYAKNSSNDMGLKLFPHESPWLNIRGYGIKGMLVKEHDTKTIDNFCQRLWQIDRYLNLTNYVGQQRRGYNFLTNKLLISLAGRFET